MPLFDSSQLEVCFQLLYAVLLGAFVGLERGFRGRAAGMRTYALVCLGSALFTTISLNGFDSFSKNFSVSFDPSRIIANIVVGIGFLGAGLIIFRPDKGILQGLTTAAGLWVTAAIGVAIGMKIYVIATFTAVLTVAIFYFLLRLEYHLYKGEHRPSD